MIINFKSFICFFVLTLGAVLFAPESYAIDDDSMPSGRYIDNFAIKNSIIISDIFDEVISQHSMFDRSIYSDCGYFSYITKGITVSDYNGNQGSRTFDDWVLVTILFPENINFKGTIYVGTRSFGVDPINNVQPNNNYANDTQVRSILCISSITGGGDSQFVNLAFSVECFNFDANVRLPYNDSYRPTLYFNFSNEYGGNAIFDMGGSIPSYGSIDSISSAGLLSELYDISFVVEGVSDDKHSSLISRSLDVTPFAVVDDTGYNLIYLEVPQLETKLYHNDVVWGYYLFRPRYDTDKYFFNGLKLSFAYDPLQDTSDLTSYPDSSFFETSVNSQPISPNSGLTVNSMSFLFGGSVHTYSNRVLIGYDYSSTDNNLYPTFMFHSIATCNRFSVGSFCYNFDDSGLMVVDEQGNATPATEDDKDDLADNGNDRNENTKSELGFVPRSVRFNTLNDGFSWENSGVYDFSSVGSLLGSLFSNSFILTIATACCVVGLIGYVLYGKN